MERGVCADGSDAGLAIRGSWSGVNSQDYVCVTCGYFEKHFPQGKALEKVASTWPRVVPIDRIPPNPA